MVINGAKDADTRLLRLRETDIRLRETDIRLCKAHAKAAAAEAVLLRLRIKYHKLCNSG